MWCAAFEKYTEAKGNGRVLADGAVRLKKNGANIPITFQGVYLFKRVLPLSLCSIQGQFYNRVVYNSVCVCVREIQLLRYINKILDFTNLTTIIVRSGNVPSSAAC